MPSPVLGACNDTADGGSAQARVSFVASTGTTYRIQVGGANGASGDLAVAFSGVAAPPDGLAISNTTGTSQTLTWNDLVGEKGYRVERRTGEGAWREVSRRKANVTSYVSSGLTPATTYDYRVRALSANNSLHRLQRGRERCHPSAPERTRDTQHRSKHHDQQPHT